MSAVGSKLDGILPLPAHLDLSPITSIHVGAADYFVRTIMMGLAASTLAIIYSEIMYTGTRRLYQNGQLLRYYPLPTDRGALVAWFNSMSFTIPTALVARYIQPGMVRSWDFNIIGLAAHVALYMVIHDTFFYWCHRTMHHAKPLYDYLHAMHHEYSYSMHCYIVGYAEILENFIQVGLPWMAWTLIAGHNVWYWILPLTYVLFTTLMGHSGYRSSWILMIFHPFALPVALASGGWLLNTGDHQAHHSHRRVNYGLFWKFWDQKFGTYKKCTVRAQDIHFWSKWATKKGEAEHDEQAKKWLGRNQVSFHEVEWGF